MRYVNFDLEIIPTDKESYLETAKASQEKAKAVLNSTPHVPDDWDKTSKEEIQTLGATLHAFLFGNRVGEIFETNLAAIENKKKVRLRLRLSTESAEMAAVPWEVLYDSTRKSFLSCSTKTSIIRYEDQEKIINGFAITSSLRVLLVVPNVSGFRRGDLFSELHELGVADFTLLPLPSTHESVRDALSRNYDVIHFVAPGGCNREGDYLLLDDDYGGSQPIGLKSLSEIIKSCTNLKLVILDCHSSDSNSDNESVPALGPRLIELGLPAVVGMQFPIAPSSAATFAKEFYKEICSGEEVGRIDTAVTHARFCVWKDPGAANDFAAPILFARTPEGMIFWSDEEELPLFSRAWLSAFIEKIRPFARRRAKRAKRLRVLKDARHVVLQNIKFLKGGDAEIPAKQTLENRLQDEKNNLAKLEDLLWPWGKTLLVTLVFCLFLGFASETTMLNKLNLDTYLTYWMIDCANERRKPEIDKTKLTLVSMENPDTGGLRKDIVNLLPLLRDSGARVVLIDINFQNPAPEADKLLADKIAEVSNSISLLTAAEEMREDGSPVKRPTETLVSALQGKYGTVEVDATPIGDNGTHVVRKAVLGRYVGSNEPDKLEEEIPLYPSLALRAIMAQESIPYTTRNVFYDTTTGEIRVDGSEVQKADLRFPASNPFWDNSVPPKYRAFAHIDYARSPPDIDIPYSRINARRNEKKTLEDWFLNRIVLIYIPASDTQFQNANRETWRGAVIQANVISNLLHGPHIKRLQWTYRLSIILLMAAIGLIFHTRYLKALTQYTVSFPLKVVVQSLTLPVVGVVVAILYIVIAESIYESRLIVFDLTYPVIALIASYFGLAGARKVFLSKWS